jgi:hypothetical protein
MQPATTHNPTKKFLVLGLIGLLPLLFLTVVGTRSLSYPAADLVPMVAAYFAFFSFFVLLNTLGYWLKTRNGGTTSRTKSQIHFVLAIAAFGVFGLGALLGPQIGSRLVGGFVALSLLLMLVCQVIFIVNLFTKKTAASATELDDVEVA